MKNLISDLQLKSNFNKNYLIIICSFLIGATIPIIPYLSGVIFNINNQRILELKKDNIKKNLIEDCKSKNIKYTTLLDLGFQRFAEEELKICLNKELKKIQL